MADSFTSAAAPSAAAGSADAKARSTEGVGRGSAERASTRIESTERASVRVESAKRASAGVESAEKASTGLSRPRGRQQGWIGWDGIDSEGGSARERSNELREECCEVWF
ncbi:hypothetical protein L6452_38934 [Arctium lappa]|uniref:Uncharacterized protein n=1 Tax=Arctium lappa TaxID=4217 RepID=A0ACB8XRG4_ARCLA|nr:hypothetical protein L6452_38934 [Arctium lappa]